MEQSANSKIDKLTETTEIKMQQMAEGIEKLTESMEHFNGTYKSGNAGVAMLMEKVFGNLRGLVSRAKSHHIQTKKII